MQFPIRLLAQTDLHIRAVSHEHLKVVTYMNVKAAIKASNHRIDCIRGSRGGGGVGGLDPPEKSQI